MDSNSSRRRRRGDSSNQVPGWGCGLLVLSIIILAFLVGCLIVAIVHHDHHKKHAQEVWEHIAGTTECDEPCDATTPSHFWGIDLSNTHYRDCDPINASNVHELELFCDIDVGADVQSIPSIDEKGVAYFVTWGGEIYAVQIQTCAVIWSNTIEFYTGVASDIARTTPALDPNGGRYVIIGTGHGPNAGGAKLVAINTSNGALRWVTEVDDHPYAIITQAPVIYNDLVWVGISSNEEAALALDPEYPGPTFQGSFVELTANTGHLVRRFTTVDGDVTGGAVWGSTAVIDPVKQRACFTTGNNYDEYPVLVACNAGPNPNQCLSDNNQFINAFVCLDMTGLDLVWGAIVNGSDAWNVACIFDPFMTGNCPEEPGPDYDFAQGPMLGEVYNCTTGVTRQALFAGQKSGVFWARDYETGEPIWARQIAPGSIFGGFQWGSALGPDGIYAANTNGYYLDYQLLNGSTTCSGSWVKLDPNTGATLWQTLDPNGIIGADECASFRASLMMAKHGTRSVQGDSPFYAWAHGPITVVNDVVFAGSMSGYLYGMDAATGEILFSFDTFGSYNTAPSVWNGYLITGGGYARIGFGQTKVRVFRLP